MRALLGLGGFMTATVGTTLALLGTWIPRPQHANTVPLYGIRQAFHPCPRCQASTTHIVHTNSDRTCQDCRHTTHGDPR